MANSLVWHWWLSHLIVQKASRLRVWPTLCTPWGNSQWSGTASWRHQCQLPVRSTLNMNFPRRPWRRDIAVIVVEVATPAAIQFRVWSCIRLPPRQGLTMLWKRASLIPDGGYIYDSTSIRRQFDRATTIRHPTSWPGCCAAA